MLTLLSDDGRPLAHIGRGPCAGRALGGMGNGAQPSARNSLAAAFAAVSAATLQVSQRVFDARQLGARCCLETLEDFVVLALDRSFGEVRLNALLAVGAIVAKAFDPACKRAAGLLEVTLTSRW